MNRDLQEKKKYVRPVIKLARDPTEGAKMALQPAQPPTSTSNVTGATVF